MSRERAALAEPIEEQKRLMTTVCDSGRASDDDLEGIRDFVALLRWRAATHPDMTAYVFLDKGETETVRLTYCELDRRARAIAARLQLQWRAEDAERALLLYPPGLDYIAAFFGCLYAGVIAVPAYPPSGRHRRRLDAITENARPRAILTTAALRRRFHAQDAGDVAQPDLPWIATDDIASTHAQEWTPFSPEPDQLAFLQYTSGSTGEPRGVMISHANLIANEALIKENFAHARGATLVGWLPLYHDMGLIGNVLQPLYAGGTAVLMSPLAFLEKPLRWLKAISTYGATTSGGPNFAYDLCVRAVTEADKQQLDLSRWTIAFSGAEPVRPKTLERFAAAFAGCGFRREAFQPCYGLAEATLVATAPPRGRTPSIRHIDRKAAESDRVADGEPLALVGCGTAQAGHEVRIVDPKTGTRCAKGEIGEIWVAGPSVARGYWGRPEETENIFAQRLDGENRRYLRTGDLGFLENGELYIAGRLKDLVIIAGRNYYAEDLERTLDEAIDDLRPGCSAAFSIEMEDDEKLIILAEPRKSSLPALRETGPDALLKAISETLAADCDVTPTEILLVEPGSVPKTSSGKIQRALCRQRYRDGSLSIIARSAPLPANGETLASPAEPSLLREALALLAPEQRARLITRLIIAEAARLLHLSETELGETTRLMSAGFDSLRALELKHAIDQALGGDSSLALFLSDEPIATLAAALSAEPRPHADLDAAARARSDEDPGLSFTQRAIWSTHRLDPSGAANTIHLALRVGGRIDADRLKGALAVLSARHPMLRAVFRDRPAGPVQQIPPATASDLSFTRVDAGSWTQERLRSDMTSRAFAPFDLAEGPLFRATLYPRSDEDATLLLCAHHIALDLWSFLILLKELGEAYHAAASGRPPAPVDAGASYLDFVRWQRRRTESAEGDADWAYWREKLAGDLPILALSPRSLASERRGNLGAAHDIRLDPDVTATLEQFARARGVTLFMVLLAVYKIILFHHTQQRDIIVGTAASGRPHRRFASVVGNFVNPLALRSHIRPRQTFSAFLNEVRREVLGALDHRDFPFSLIVDRLNPPRATGRWPIFQTWFALQQAQDGMDPGYAQLALGGNTSPIPFAGMTIEGVALAERVERFDLKLMAATSERGLTLSFQYLADLFESEEIVRLAERFERVMRAIVAAPDTLLYDLPLSGADETRSLLEAAHGDARPRELRPAHALFSQWARETPTAPALAFADTQTSYAEVEARANKLAHFLRGLGVASGEAVAFCAPRTDRSIITLLAIGKAGAVYVPIDPDLPGARIGAMLQDASARFLLCEADWFARKEISGVRPVFVDLERAAIEAQAAAAPDAPVGPLDLAYILFTSGSTGRPKGVAIPHGALSNYVAAISAEIGANGLRFALASTLAADLGNTSLYGALATGGSIHLLTQEEASDARLFSSVMKRHRIDVLKIVPSHFDALTASTDIAEAMPRELLIFGGERLAAPLGRRALAAARGARIYNHYGPTETCVGALMRRLQGGDLNGDAAPIGRPLANLRALLLDAEGALSPRGASGEICIGGAGLARGYVGRPDLTAERFRPDPFGAPGERLYHTGDFGRIGEDGAASFVGRIDDQIKIRGFRVEIGEIEARLLACDGVRGAAVTPYEGPAGATRLLAHVVLHAGEEASGERIAAELSRSLPDHMIPRRFAFPAELPITANGKIDRRRLASTPIAETEATSYRAPRTDLETRLAAIFAGTLRVERVGLDDNFFALGGDSISSIRAASRACAEGLDVAPRQIFENQSVAELARALEASGTTAARKTHAPEASRAAPARSDCGARDAQASYPLTPLQEGLLFHSLSRPGSGVYVMQHRYWIEGEIDVALFRAAWERIVATHAIFRTSFEWENLPRPRQIVHSSIGPHFEFLDLRDLSSEGREAHLDALLERERRAGFDLGAAPLFRIRLARLEERRYVLIRSHHHILFDAWCTSLILEELLDTYRALSEGRTPKRREERDFEDYVLWLQRQDRAAAEAFWRRRLEGFREPTPLVGAIAGAARRDDDLDVEDLVVHLSQDDTARLGHLARELRVTENSFVQAAMAILLARYTGRDDILFGVTVSGRPPALEGVEQIIGLFINCLPLRLSFSPEATLPAFLTHVLTQNYEIRSFEYSSLTDVQAVSEIPRGTDFFDYLLTFENAPVHPALLEARGSWRFVDCWHRTHTNYPLTFVVIPGERLHLQASFLPARIDRRVAQRMLGHFRRLLEQTIARPRARLGELRLHDEREWRMIVTEWNRSERDFGEPRDILRRFEQQARLTPEAGAARCRGAAITYRRLNECANRLGHALIDEGVGPDRIVALLDSRGLDFLVAILAIFKAGGAYLPLDPAHPDGRIEKVLAEASAPLLLVGEAFASRAEAIVARLPKARPKICERSALEARARRTDDPSPRHCGGNLAFVIYTSGSTGAPKGAMVEHFGMFNNAITKVPALCLTARDVIAQTASQCFDISVWQFLTALMIGARVEIFPDEISQDPTRLIEEIAARGVSILETVPSMIGAFLDLPRQEAAKLASLRWLIPCGEAFTPELCRRFMESFPSAKILNAYGPAECSDDVSYHPIDTPPEGNELSVPIGRPVDNVSLYILDRRQEPVPLGASGEICVGGVQVGRGYLARPDLTAKAFIPDPFGEAGRRLYRTGDLGRFRADGVIEFLGRIDHQVKIRGFRVEPGEVEACLAGHPLVKQACVIAKEAAKGTYRLIAFVVGEGVTAHELREHLRRSLPDHMIPAAFSLLDALPLTPNGKVDRRRLLEADVELHADRRRVAPRSDAELALSRIWAELLDAPEIGVEDNFFELGGHSLLAIQARSRIHAAFDVDLPLRAIFDAPTIAELASWIEEAIILSLKSLSEDDAERLHREIIWRSDGSAASGVKTEPLEAQQS